MGLQLKLTTNNFNKKFLKNYPALRIGGTCVFQSGGEREVENATTKDAVPKGRRC